MATFAAVTRLYVGYESHGRGYAERRRTDPRIAARIHAALGDARTVVNVGAGTGSYEPDDRWVLAVEPSATMRAQRPAGAAPAIDARAEVLPLDDDSVDAAMACITIHHWEPPEAGLAEMRRVARGGRRVHARARTTQAIPWQVLERCPRWVELRSQQSCEVTRLVTSDPTASAEGCGPVTRPVERIARLPAGQAMFNPQSG